jgi:hypothetical protein
MISFINSPVKYKALAGQEEWTSSSGTFSWVVPRGVFTISAVCVGGGGGGGGHATAYSTGGAGGALTWANYIRVTPGETLTIIVGAGGGNVIAQGNGGNGGDTFIKRGSITLVGADGGLGGLAGASVSGRLDNTAVQSTGTGSNIDFYTLQQPGDPWLSGLDPSVFGYSYGGTSYSVASQSGNENSAGGGGAAGYVDGSIFNNAIISGGIGNPSTRTGQVGSFGGGSGGNGGANNTNPGAGGGVGAWGLGSTAGAPSAGNGFCGIGGSGGLPSASYNSVQGQTKANVWSPSGWSQNGGLFGGGGAGAISSNQGIGSGFGARGVVRIMWGENRLYPSTNTQNYYGTDAVTNSQQNYFTPGSYTWTVPAGVREFSVCVIGGGGAGGQGTTTTGKGSGAGGALAWGNFPCMPGETFTVVAGDAGQSTALNTQTSGGTSSVTRNVSFKGFISGTNLFVTEMISGLITTGITITGAGVTSTNINAFQTGEYGFEGTYTISVSQTVGSLTSPITFSGTLSLLTAGGGEAARAAGAGTPAGGTYSVHASAKSSGGMNGGAGGPGSTSTTAQGAGGGGAGGYSGTAGGAAPNAGTAQNGAYPTPYGGANLTNLTGGSTSGSTGKASLACGGGGGGTGIYGWDKDPLIDSGQGTTLITSAGIAGSLGQDGSVVASTGQGGQFGGGGGGAGNNFSSGRSNGGIGGVRITWGARHKYPTPTTDV